MSEGSIQQDVAYIVNNDKRQLYDFYQTCQRVRAVYDKEHVSFLTRIVKQVFLQRTLFVLSCLKRLNVPKHVDRMIVQFALDDNMLKFCRICDVIEFCGYCVFSRQIWNRLKHCQNILLK